VARTVVLFVDLLLRKKRLTEYETIVTEFEALVEKLQGVQRAHVVSAVPLTDAEQKRLHGELERHTKSKIRLTSEVDSGLIGGALVRIGDRVIDRSVATLLKAIEQQLSEISV
jgi:F-type H+-transporting ATPase subunit delta